MSEMKSASSLAAFLRKELVSIPIAHWGYFFPCHVAVWRFIEEQRPGAIEALCAGYDTEPYFSGRGSEWFCGILGNDDEYISLMEKIMYPVVDILTSEAIERGFLLEVEMPVIVESIVECLKDVVLNRVDEGLIHGKIF